MTIEALKKNIETKLKDSKDSSFEKELNELQIDILSSNEKNEVKANTLADLIDSVQKIETKKWNSEDNADKNEIISSLEEKMNLIITTTTNEWFNSNNSNSLFKNNFMREFLKKMNFGTNELYFNIYDSKEILVKNNFYKTLDYFKNSNKEFVIDFKKLENFFQTFDDAWVDIKTEEFWKTIFNWDCSKERTLTLKKKDSNETVQIKMPWFQDLSKYIGADWNMNSSFYSDLNSIISLNKELTWYDKSYDEYNSGTRNIDVQTDNAKVKEFIGYANELLGKPYVRWWEWTDNKQWWADCSGLVYYAATKMWKKISRVATDQWKNNVASKEVNSVKAWDLVFRKDWDRMWHVMIALWGVDEKWNIPILHAPRTWDVIKVTTHKVKSTTYVWTPTFLS